MTLKLKLRLMLKMTTTTRHTDLLALLAAAVLLTAAAGCNRGKGGETSAGGGEAPYRLTVEGPSRVALGTRFKARVKVEPRGAYKVNLEYPAQLAVNASGGALPGELQMEKGEAARLTEQELLMEPAFKAEREGEVVFEGKLAFSVCTEAVCEVKREPVKWVTNITK